MGHYVRNEKTKTGKSVTGQYLDLTIPYHFSELARRRQENLLVGDYVAVRGLDKRYELMEIFRKYGSVRVREVGHVESMTFPWHAVTPWKKRNIRSDTEMQTIGNWLFGGNLVYRLAEPDRMLKQRTIHWDRQTCDVEDEEGRVLYDISWDDLEFWDPVDYHLPDDD